MKVDRLDHLALTVRDIEVSCAFYSQVLGLEIITLDGGRKALHFGDASSFLTLLLTHEGNHG